MCSSIPAAARLAAPVHRRRRSTSTVPSAVYRLGYNWQSNQDWLLGIETDFNWSRIKGTGTDSLLIAPGLFPGPSSFVANKNVEWFGTVRSRLGFLPTTNLLVYGTAGFAYRRNRA
jgi:outer membrane immunogenic protein